MRVRHHNNDFILLGIIKSNWNPFPTILPNFSENAIQGQDITQTTPDGE